MGGLRRTEFKRKSNGGENKGLTVLVAVEVSKEITDHALDWAIRNVVQPEDTLILLALLKSTFSSKKLQLQSVASSEPNNQSSFNHLVASLLKKWGIRKDCFKEKALDIRNREANNVNSMNEWEIRRLNEVCSEMMYDLCCKNNVKRVNTQVKLVACPQVHSVAIKAEELQASWIVLDRQLKDESEYCSRHLSCNVILIDHAIAKVLRLVNKEAKEEEPENTDTFLVQNQSNTSSCSSSSSSSSSTRSSSRSSSSSLGFNSDQDSAAQTFVVEHVPFMPTLRHYINIIPEDESLDQEPEGIPKLLTPERYKSADEQRDESPVPFSPEIQKSPKPDKSPVRLPPRRQLTCEV